MAGGDDGTRGNPPDHIKTVTVPIFKNRTLEPGAESAITSGVVNAFSSGGAMLWRREGPQETSDLQVEGSVSDTVALAVDRF